MPTHADYGITALCLWREARGEGIAGMTAVASVIMNRVRKHGTTPFVEVVAPWQFSSMTAEGDTQLIVYPEALDAQWVQAQTISQSVLDGSVSDPTGGATLYWSPNGIRSTKMFTLNDGTQVKFPQSWNPTVVRETVKIGAHVFLKELI